MTKIKNTKKGMAKKTLSMSLVVAMLATSNVPVWAAEFSAGEDAVVTSDAETPAVDTADEFTDDASAQAAVVDEAPAVEDTSADVATAADKTGLAVTLVNEDGKVALGNVANVKATIQSGIASSFTSDKSWPSTGEKASGAETRTRARVDWAVDGGAVVSNYFYNDETSVNIPDSIKAAATIGKTVTVKAYIETVNTRRIIANSYRWGDTTSTSAETVSFKVIGNSAADYCASTPLSAEWGTKLSDVAVNPTMQYGASYENGAWYKNGQKVDADYTTTQADITSTFEYKVALKNTGSDFDGAEVTAATLAIIGKSAASISTVAWSGFSTEVANNGTLSCDYDGNAHQITIDHITATNGDKISDAKLKYTYTRDGAETTDFTSAGTITVTATVVEAGVLAENTIITTTLTIKGTDISKNNAATLTTNPLVYNKAHNYLNLSGKTGDALAEAVKEAGIVVEKDGKTLTCGEDYTITAVTLKNEVGAEKVQVTVNGIGNYTGSIVKKLDITAADVSKATVVDIPDQPYSGNQIKPAVTVTVNGETLVANTDYTVEYSNNVNVGKDATVTITGKGNYTGTITKTFEITSISLANLKKAIEGDLEWKGTKNNVPGTGYDYTGKAIDPIKDAYGCKSANAVWMKGRDFSVTYVPQNTNSGDVKVVLTGINNYAGQTAEVNFKINQVNISKVKADLSNVTYSPDLDKKKDEIKAGLKVTYKDTELVEKQDFTIDNISISGKKIYLTLTGIKNFTGTTTVSADVTAKDISTVILPKIDAQKYTGSEIKVIIDGNNGLKLTSGSDTLAEKLALKDGETTLKSSDYYIINVENNTKVGTATINLGGKGNYTGKVSLSFPIVDQELNGTIVDGTTKSTILGDVKYKYSDASTIKGITYTGLKVMDENGKDITDKCDITYSDNKAVGTATITATGKDGFKFNAVNTFRITPAKLTGKLALKKSSFDYTGEEIKPEYTFTAKDGDYTLVEGTDYKVEYENNVNAVNSSSTKKPTVKVTGLGNYAGTTDDGKEITITMPFTIKPVTLTTTDIVANDVAYASGIPVKANVVITNSKSGKALVEGTDYKVTITKGGTNVGPAEAKIELTETGKQNYVLADTIATVKFNVTAFDLSKATISEITDQTVTGEQIKPTVVVMNGSVRLVEGYDYEVTYGDNKEVGEGTVTIKALNSNKNYTGSQTVKFNIVEKAAEVGQAMIADVKVSGNTVTPILSGDVDGAVGYDYVLATEENTTDGRIDISKNILSTHTNFYYVPEGTYYVYCHAWKRGEDGKKVFGEWSNIKEVKVEATTPSTPTITSVKVKGSTVTVTYTESENATGYDVVLGTSVKKVNGERRPVEYGKLVKKNVEEGTVEVTFTNVPAGTYYAGLHAYNRTSANASKVFSKWSNHKTARVK